MPIKILIWFWSGMGGGGSRFAVNLADKLRSRFANWDVGLSLSAKDALVDEARARALKVLTAPIVSNRRKPLATLMGLTRARRVLSAHTAGADVVIIPMNFAFAAPLSGVLKNTRLVYCVHDHTPHQGDYAVRLQKLTQALLLRRASDIVALSAYVHDQLARAGKLARLAPLASVYRPASAEHALRREPVRLLFAGRMIAYKGLDLLADALDLLNSPYPWRLSIAGAGPALTPALHARLSAHPNVDIISNAWLHESVLDGLVAESDALLLPYHSATQSGIIAQAQAAGKLCIVTPVGALGEQIGEGEGGWIATAATAPAYAAAIDQMLEDADARARKSEAALARAARAWSAPDWDWLAP